MNLPQKSAKSMSDKASEEKGLWNKAQRVALKRYHPDKFGHMYKCHLVNGEEE